ncbi:MAG: MazG-like family protein [Micromonosporaceae bacterium]
MTAIFPTQRRDGELLGDAVRAAASWLDEHNGASREDLGLRVLKVVEESGEAAAAWIGVTGQNPRKGYTHSYADVAAELADVAFAALVAIESLNGDAAEELHAVADKVLSRTAETVV